MLVGSVYSVRRLVGECIQCPGGGGGGGGGGSVYSVRGLVVLVGSVYSVR